MYCIFDTETSGLFDFTRPADAEGQPRLASIAMLACDESLNLIAATCVLVRPDGWQMSAEAERINGLSQELLTRHGVPVHEVLIRYVEEIERGAIIAAHNADFDTKVMRGELRRAGLPDMFERTRTICTMRGLTEFCKIPSLRNGGYKWPRLAEALRLCLNREHHGAHGCLPDALACLDLLRFMRAERLLRELDESPEVAHASA